MLCWKVGKKKKKKEVFNFGVKTMKKQNENKHTTASELLVRSAVRRLALDVIAEEL